MVHQNISTIDSACFLFIVKLMKTKQKGFTAIEGLLLLIIVGIIGFTGWYVWHAKRSADKTLDVAASENISSSRINKNSPKPVPLTKRQQQAADFSVGSIKNSEKIPVGAQPLIIADARKEIIDCSSGLNGNQFETSIAQSNFVAVGMGCITGQMHYYAQDSGKWSLLGSGVFGLDCAWVSRYKIVQSSLVQSPAECRDFEGSGQTETVPM